jgi:hypothetical protein
MATSRKAPDLVLDTSPQLGGNLDVNGNTVDGVDIATRDGVLTSTTTTANNALPKAGGAMTGAITTNSTFDGVDIATRDGVLTSTTTTANNALPKAGGAMTGAITTNSTFDGRDVATDGSKLDGIESGATADQTNTQIKTAYEANADTNEFSDAEQTKLAGIATSANNYSLPVATSSTYGGVKVSLSGTHLTITA